MLQVGVERGDVTRLARQHALEQGAGKTAAADAPDAANAAVGFADGTGDGCRSIGRVVVDKNDFPINSDQEGAATVRRESGCSPAVQGRDDDGNFRRRGDGWRNGVGLIQQTRICGERGSHGFFSCPRRIAADCYRGRGRYSTQIFRSGARRWKGLTRLGSARARILPALIRQAEAAAIAAGVRMGERDAGRPCGWPGVPRPPAFPPRSTPARAGARASACRR